MTPTKPLPFSADAIHGKTFHFIGIGGCGMSGLAQIINRLGGKVQGTDAVASTVTEKLINLGIPVTFEQDGSEITNDIDVVVHSAAIPDDHPEILASDRCGIPLVTYSKMLGIVQTRHTGVCIAGTHGKSTTVSMLSAILLSAGIDPSFIVGANCEQIGGSCRVGAAEVPVGRLKGSKGMLISESCEFNRSFHDHDPTLALIHNLEEDHLDYYQSLDAIIEAFKGFALSVPHENQGGYLLIAHDGAHRQLITPGLQCKVETFGFHPEADYQVFFDPAVKRVGILREGIWIIQWTNAMLGSHNALNAVAAAILAAQLGVDWDDIVEPLETFQGVDRRLQKVCTLACKDGGTATVYDDYGHHPTEIEMTLRAIRASELPKRLICIFQPHQHSRTRFLLDQFAQSFSSADEVIVPHIYFVRDSEAEKQRVSAQDLVDKLIAKGSVAKHYETFEEIVAYVRSHARDGDLITVMGAGPVTSIAHDLCSTPELNYNP